MFYLIVLCFFTELEDKTTVSQKTQDSDHLYVKVTQMTSANDVHTNTTSSNVVHINTTSANDVKVSKKKRQNGIRNCRGLEERQEGVYNSDTVDNNVIYNGVDSDVVSYLQTVDNGHHSNHVACTSRCHYDVPSQLRSFNVKDDNVSQTNHGDAKFERSVSYSDAIEQCLMPDSDSDSDISDVTVKVKLGDSDKRSTDDEVFV